MCAHVRVCTCEGRRSSAKHTQLHPPATCLSLGHPQAPWGCGQTCTPYENTFIHQLKVHSQSSAPHTQRGTSIDKTNHTEDASQNNHQLKVISKTGILTFPSVLGNLVWPVRMCGSLLHPGLPGNLGRNGAKNSHPL